MRQSSFNQFDKTFWRFYNANKKLNFKSKSLAIIRDAKKYTSENLSILHTNYESSFGQIIGSMLSTLIYKAAKEPNDYLNSRYAYLNEIAEILKTRNAYKDLFDFLKAHFSQNIDSINTEYQIIQEIEEILNLVIPFNMILVGLNGKNPIDCYNAGDIECVLLQETQGILLYKVIFRQPGWIVNQKGHLVDDINGGHFCGIIDLRSFELDSDSYFPFSIMGNITEYMDKCFDIYDFILECYADLVCGPEYYPAQEKRLNSTNPILQEQNVSDNDIEDHFKNSETVGLRYTPINLYKLGKRNSNRTSAETREKYYVTGHLRKLFDGAEASRDAIKNAEEYGIQVPKGFTFVTPHFSGIDKIRTRYRKIIT